LTKSASQLAADTPLRQPRFAFDRQIAATPYCQRWPDAMAFALRHYAIIFTLTPAAAAAAYAPSPLRYFSASWPAPAPPLPLLRLASRARPERHFAAVRRRCHSASFHCFRIYTQQPRLPYVTASHAFHFIAAILRHTPFHFSDFRLRLSPQFLRRCDRKSAIFQPPLFSPLAAEPAAAAAGHSPISRQPATLNASRCHYGHYCITISG